jgi:hypothetical protein
MFDTRLAYAQFASNIQVNYQQWSSQPNKLSGNFDRKKCYDPYFGSSEYTARQKFTQAILSNPPSTRVELRVDGRIVRRVTIEQLPNWPWQQ